MSREKKVTPMKLAAGSIRRRGKNGCFAYRCQVNGRRTEISLQTCDYHEALKKVAELVPIAQARTAEVVVAHVNEARGFAKQTMDLTLADSWDKYLNFSYWQDNYTYLTAFVQDTASPGSTPFAFSSPGDTTS